MNQFSFETNHLSVKDRWAGNQCALHAIAKIKQCFQKPIIRWTYVKNYYVVFLCASDDILSFLAALGTQSTTRTEPILLNVLSTLSKYKI
jgi:DNA-binding transcriptional regulator WhiA